MNSALRFRTLGLALGIAVLTTFGAPGLAHTHAPTWTVQVDPLTVALGYPHVLIETRVTPYVSVYVGPHARLFSPPFGPQEPYLGFGGEVGARLFPFGKAPTGLWLGVRGVAAQAFTLDDSGPPAVAGYVSALGGYALVLWDHLVLSGALGVQYIHYRVGQYGPVGVFPAAHTAVGFAF